jgi:hypothetical protein
LSGTLAKILDRRGEPTFSVILLPEKHPKFSKAETLTGASVEKFSGK